MSTITSTTTTHTTYRIFFTKELTNEMHKFANNHTKTKSKIFRQEWNQWILQSNIHELIDQTFAINQKKDSTINKNTLYDKIYESIRYHHRKKILSSTTTTTSTNIQKPDRKIYIMFSPHFVNIINNHVQQNYQKKPEHAYELFLQSHSEEIIQEKAYLHTKYDKLHLYDLDHTHTDFHLNKFKRNYKNKIQQFKRQKQES